MSRIESGAENFNLSKLTFFPNFYNKYKQKFGSV